MEDRKSKIIYLPVILLLTWFCLTFLVFIFGPWEYRLTNLFAFYSYLFLVNIALLLGYIFGQKEDTKVSKIEINYHPFVEISVIISILYLIVKLILTRGGDIQNLIGTFKNATEAYSISSLKHSNFFSYIDIIFTPISVIAITNGIFWHKKLNIVYKFCVYFMIIVSISSSIGSATRAGIIQLFVISLAALLLSFYKKFLIIRYHHKFLIVFFVISINIGYTSYSNFLVKTRDQLNTSINPVTLEQPKKDYFLYKITPKDIHPLINSTSFYLSHSYYRLNRALDLPFLGAGFGLSNSYFIIDNVEQYTGWSGLKKISYGMRLDEADLSGYGNFGQLSTHGLLLILHFLVL